MGWKLYRGIPKTHNYLKKLARLQVQGALPVGVGVHQLDIYHDDWCRIYKGKRCNCNPDLRLKTIWHPGPRASDTHPARGSTAHAKDTRPR